MSILRFLAAWLALSILIAVVIPEALRALLRRLG